MENMNDNTKTANQDQKRKDKIALIIAIIIIIIGFSTLIPSFTSSNDDKPSYEDNLRSGMSKYYSGESMSKEEYDAVSNFKDWKDKQSSKSYSDWESGN